MKGHRVYTLVKKFEGQRVSHKTFNHSPTLHLTTWNVKNVITHVAASRATINDVTFGAAGILRI